MATEVKAFSHNATYTVPSGRTAKVIFNNMIVQGGIGGHITVGATQLASQSDSSSGNLQFGGGGVIPVSGATATVQPGVGQVLGERFVSSAIVPAVYTKEFYLAAGQSITSNGATFSGIAIEVF